MLFLDARHSSGIEYRPLPPLQRSIRAESIIGRIESRSDDWAYKLLRRQLLGSQRRERREAPLSATRAATSLLNKGPTQMIRQVPLLFPRQTLHNASTLNPLSCLLVTSVVHRIAILRQITRHYQSPAVSAASPPAHSIPVARPAADNPADRPRSSRPAHI
jgi:hypothetical protein